MERELQSVSNMRRLADLVYAGGREAPFRFADLVSRLFLSTIAYDRGGAFFVVPSNKEKHVYVITGWNSELEPIRLNNGGYLRISMVLSLNDKSDPFLRVRKQMISYEADQDRQADWIFRYDYVRNAEVHYPPSHLQLHGKLHAKDVLPVGKKLERIHFPTERISIESIIRLLINDFNVEVNEFPEKERKLMESELTNTGKKPSDFDLNLEIARMMLRSTERRFHEIKHRH